MTKNPIYNKTDKYKLSRILFTGVKLSDIISVDNIVIGVFMDFVIDDKNAGKSMLVFLKNIVGISSSTISHLKQIPDGICANGNHVTVRYILCDGDIVSIKTQDTEEMINESISPQNLDVEIVYEDDHIIAVNKPVNMPTHPSHNHHNDTLGNAMAYVYSQRNIPFVFRPAGRLDKNTSGLVILSKTRAAASFYFNEAKRGRIQKHYIAVLDGEIEADKDTVYSIDAPIKRMGDSIITRITSSKDDPDASCALTMWKLIYSGNGISIVDAYPITGRTHQIRVHFTSIGHALVGDTLYGDGKYGFDCHLLHAVTLKTKECFSDKSLKLYADPNHIMKEFVRETTKKELSEILDNYNFFEDLSQGKDK